VDDLTWNL